MSAMPEKIMFLGDCYEGPHAGTEGQILQLIQHLDRSRYEPSMTLLRSSPYIERNQFPCPVQCLGIVKMASIQSIFRFLRFCLTLRKQNYRIVHCFLNDVSLIAPPLLKIFGIRVLISRRDMGFWYNRWNLAILKLSSAFVDRYVANSQAVARIVEQQERVPPGKISVIYNGYAPRAKQSEGVKDKVDLPQVPSHHPVVGIVANLKPIKRIDVLIGAFAIALKECPTARLLIVGGDGLSCEGGSMLVQLERQADDLGIRDHIVFAGRVGDPAPYINRFSVAVLCSESEGFSNALVEYMQAGRAVVCTDSGGNRELVEHGVNGFLVPVGDVGVLADHLVRLLSDSGLARKLGEAARLSVQSTYSHTRMVTEQMACYDSVLTATQLGW
jgi:glycosyltransferase involved in cell wall biosynthesis